MVQNHTDLLIESLRFEYLLEEGRKIFVSLKNISPGESKEKEHGAITPKCPVMKQKRLRTIDLKKCKICDVINQGCMQYIKFK